MPHHQDTGGFFLAVFTKTKPIPPSALFMKATFYKNIATGEKDPLVEQKEALEDNNEESNYGMEVAMMEELTFGIRVPVFKY